MNDLFRKFSSKTSQIVGSSWAFIIAVIVIVGWAISGPIFHFSDAWQLLINTATTIVTFLMVFLIQNTQNRDAKAIHLKLNELIHALAGAQNDLMEVKRRSNDQQKHPDAFYGRVREKGERGKGGRGAKIQSRA